jgi:hypothetical protein
MENNFVIWLGLCGPSMCSQAHTLGFQAGLFSLATPFHLPFLNMLLPLPFQLPRSLPVVPVDRSPSAALGTPTPSTPAQGLGGGTLSEG